MHRIMRVAPTCRAAVRCFSTPPLTPDAASKLKVLQDDIRTSVKGGIADMQRVYGEPHPELAWQTQFYRPPPPNAPPPYTYLVPALSLAHASGAATGHPSLVAKNVVFFAAALRTVPPPLALQYLSTLPVLSVDTPFMLSLARCLGTTEGDTLLTRVGVSAARAGAADVQELLNAVEACPRGCSPHTWTVPWEAATGLSPNWRETAYPFEVTPSFAAARASLPLDDWLVLSGTTVIEGCWAGFYATGDARCLARVIDVAAGWAVDGAGLPESHNFLLSLEAALPTELVEVGAPGSAGYDAACVRSARLQVGRVACWSLLHHALHHPKVWAAMADAAKGVAGWVGTAGESGDDELDRRVVEVVPGLMHLAARLRLQTVPQSALDLKVAN